MGKNDRFQVVYTQGAVDVIRVLLDTQTGALYLQTVYGNCGGLAPLMGRDGKPARWQQEEEP